jgi:hypothetical protein
LYAHAWLDIIGNQEFGSDFLSVLCGYKLLTAKIAK